MPADPQHASPRPDRARWIMAPLAVLAMFAASTVIGAISLRLSALTGLGGVVLALVNALLFAVVLPLLLDHWLTGAYRKLDTGAPSSWSQTVLGWDLVLLAFAIFAAPKTTRDALETHGGWLFGSTTQGGLIASNVGRLARHIPRSEPAIRARTSGEHPAPPALSRERPQASATSAIAAALAAPPPSIPDQPQTAEQIFELRVGSVVVISGREPIPNDAQFKSFFSEMGVDSMATGGSGFIVSEDGLVVTRYSVIEGASTLEVALRDGRKFDQVTIEVSDRPRDLALLRVDATGLPRAPLSDADEITPGSRAIALGSPLGVEFVLNDGIVGGTRVIDNTIMLQMQTAIAPGSSGGPLLDYRGRVIGVNTASKGAGMNLAIFVKHVRDLLARTRSAQRLPPQKPQARISAISIEGSPASPAELVQTKEQLSLIALAGETCVKQTPEKPELSVRFLLDRRGFMTHDAVVSSNLAEADVNCLRRAIDRFGRPVAMVLAQTYPGKVRKGETVTLDFALDGLPLATADARANSRHTIPVRLTLGAEGETAP